MQLSLAIVVALAVFCNGFPTEERRDNIDERGEFYQGDMKLAPGMKAGIIGSNYRWPNAQVPYTLSSTFTAAERAVVMEGLNEISSKTCITFKARSNEANYVAITRGTANSGCWSYVGRQGGGQQLNLQPGSPGCVFKGIVAHEMIHALGFFHEQSRTDRDDYVVINWSNIQAGTESNFDKYPASQIDPFNTAYDYGSVMNYSAYSFAVNPNVPTITPRDSTAQIGQRDGLSAKDAQKLKNMYNC